MTGSIWVASASGRTPSSPTATGTVRMHRIGNREYRVVFDRAVTVPAGRAFLIGVDADVAALPFLPAGTTTRTLRKAHGSATWTPAGNEAWHLKVLCERPLTSAPELSATGAARIGSNLDVHLDHAPAGAQAFLSLGLSDRVWQRSPLPLDLAPFGAPGCEVLASIDGARTVPVDLLGRATYRFAFPDDPSLLGGDFYNQWIVLDPRANALGITVSNGGHARIGR